MENYLANSSILFEIHTDLEGKYLYANKSFLDKFCGGKPFEEIRGSSFVNSIVPEDIEKCISAAVEVIQDPSAIVPIILRKPAGEKGFFFNQWEFLALKNPQGELIGIRCMGFDIAQPVFNHQDDKEFVNNFETVIANISEGLMFLTDSLKVIRWNPFLQHFLGVSLRDFQFKRFTDFIAPDCIDGCQKVFIACKESQEWKRCNVQDRSQTKWMELTIYSLEKGYMVYVRDNTKMHLQALELEASRKKLKAIFDWTADVAFFIDTDFKIIFFNRRAAENAKLYHNRELKVGDSILDYIHPADHEKSLAEFQKALDGQMVFSESPVDYGSGQVIWFRTEYYPVYDDGKLIGIAMSIVNVNQIKAAQMKVIQQNLQMVEIAKVHSHQIRRPIASILGLLNLMEIAQTHEEKENYIHLIKKTAEEVDALIHKVVDFTTPFLEEIELPTETKPVKAATDH